MGAFAEMFPGRKPEMPARDEDHSGEDLPFRFPEGPLDLASGIVRIERRRLRDALRERGFTVPASQTNFLLGSVPLDAHHSAAALYAGLKSRGILVRHFDAPRLEDKLRITVGTPAQNDRLLEMLDAVMASAG